MIFAYFCIIMQILCKNYANKLIFLLLYFLTIFYFSFYYAVIHFKNKS